MWAQIIGMLLSQAAANANKPQQQSQQQAQQYPAGDPRNGLIDARAKQMMFQ